MELRKECIGLEMGSKIGMIKIEENGNFKLYKKLGLDVFKKKDVIKKSNNKRKDSVNPDGENNDK
jgi:hypothetical protein